MSVVERYGVSAVVKHIDKMENIRIFQWLRYIEATEKRDGKQAVKLFFEDNAVNR